MAIEDFEQFPANVRSTVRKFKGCLESTGVRVKFRMPLRPKGPYTLLIDGQTAGLFVPRVGRFDINFGQGFVHVPVRRSGHGNAQAFQQAARKPVQLTIEKMLERERELVRKSKIEAEDDTFLRPLDRFVGRVNRRVHRETWAASGQPRLEARVAAFFRSERPELIAELLALAEQKGLLTFQS